MTSKKRRSRTRAIKGTRVQPTLKAFNCKSCGSPVEVNVVGQTLNVVCPHCKSIIDAKDPNFKVIQEYNSKKKWFPAIPIGTMGKLKGTLWKNIGYIVKQDSGYYWSEYLLYNPYHGYRWLSEVNGHWTLYKKIYRASGVTGSPKAEYKGNKYKLFNHGTAKVEYVEGEFYWRVKRGDKSTVSDYIAPPLGLSVEYNNFEENWALGQHIEAETLRKSFKIKNELPYQQGIGMLEPSPFKKKVKENGKILVASLAALFVIMVLRKATAKNEQVFFTFLDDKHSIIRNTETTKTEEFEIKGRTGNVEIKGRAAIYNSWVYLDALLVDANTQKGIPMPIEISYYRGSDWSEGSKIKRKVISNIPPGRYYLSIKTQVGPRQPSGKIRLWLTRDVPVNSNFYIAAFLILMGPVLGFFRSHSYEARRWSNSDYSPYNSE